MFAMGRAPSYTLSLYSDTSTDISLSSASVSNGVVISIFNKPHILTTDGQTSSDSVSVLRYLLAGHSLRTGPGK